MIKIFHISALFFACILFYFGTASAQKKQQPVNQISLLFNKDNIIPFKRLDKGEMVIVSDSPSDFQAFIDQVHRYTPANVLTYSQLTTDLDKVKTLIFVGYSDNIGATQLLAMKKEIALGKTVVLCKIQKPGSSNLLKNNMILAGSASELIAYESGQNGQKELAMSLFGGLPINKTKISQGTQKTRIQYDAAANSGLDITKMTQKIDAIAKEAILEKATPGLVVMAIKDGNVIFEKSYGYHTYENTVPTKITDIFDLASVSKIAGTTPVVMNLYDQGLLNLDSTIGYYLPDVKDTDKATIPLKKVLLHEAGFTPFIPFYRTLEKGDLQRTYSSTHQVKVADSAYLKNNYYREVMWPEMMNSALKSAGKYVYSDISMYVMKEVSEHIMHTAMDKYVTENFYKPIGMATAGYNPRTRFDKNRIVPTENDTSFRKILLEGYVHDQGAAMADGVAGHAGLFATANDLAIYGQLLLNRGEYAGERYFKPETIDLFTSNQSKVSRRGLGFDRFDPNLVNEYPSKLANKSVFGHTGYTGTCIWVDPQNQLIYIFLSNRVHPQVSTKLLNLNIRSRIQDVIYETINESAHD